MLNLPEIKDSQRPILMLNMLRFKDRRLYVDEYLPAFNRVLEMLGIADAQVELLSDVLANVIADENEHWDAILLVEYPSVEVFKTVAESKAYQEFAEPLRLAALDQLKLFMTRKSDL